MSASLRPVFVVRSRQFVEMVAVSTVLGDSHVERPPSDRGAGIGRGECPFRLGDTEVNVARSRRNCQRIIDTERGRDQCNGSAAWRGSLHVGRNVYLVEACDRHRSGLIDAEPLDGNWEKRAEYA